MHALLRRRLARADRLYRDLLDVLTPEHLLSHLGELPSDTLGHQLWCVLGARQSYVAAARAGAWQGFESPVAPDTSDVGVLRDAFSRTAADVDAWLGEMDADDEDAASYAFALLEHETQHHGQLIRYLYALQIPRPVSWQQQYALDEG